MKNMEINSRKLDLLKRSNRLLEETRSNYEKYEKERKLILELTRNELVNYEQWEHILTYIENIVLMDETLKLKEVDLQYLKDLAQFLRNQRNKDTIEKMTAFKLTDNYNNSYLFLNKVDAEFYIKQNQSQFTKNSKITIIKDTKDELSSILELIERNF